MVHARLQAGVKRSEVTTFHRFARFAAATAAIILACGLSFGLLIVIGNHGRQPSGPGRDAAAPSPSPLVTPSPYRPAPPRSAPQGGFVPPELLGDWFLPPAAVEDIESTTCPSPTTGATCFYQLSFTAQTYRQAFTARGGKQQAAGSGEVVVNGNEIDFFSGVLCGASAPDDVGRYTWSITGGVLRFKLISDPCPRDYLLQYGGWSRTH
jgi:hypothetical protein